MMAGVGEAIESTESSKIWKTKNLYLSYMGSARILGIKPSVGFKSEDGDFVPGKAYLVCNLDMIAAGYPALSGVLVDVEDSKVYMIGGCAKPCDCLETDFEHCAITRSISDVVYEVDTTPGGGSLSLIPSVPIPKLREGVLFPFVAKIKGDIYVLFGEAEYRVCEASFSPPPSNLETCFMVLRKEENGWSCLPHPPFYGEDKSGRMKNFVGVIGNKLCVRVGPNFFSFDVRTKEWGSQSVSYSCLVDCQAILSISNLRGPHSVVICAKYTYEGPAKVYAALVDCDGNASHIQHIPDAMPRQTCDIYDLKLIELQRQGGDDPLSSAFCLVYPVCDPSYNVGLSVVRVSLSSSVFSEGRVRLPKRKRALKMKLFVPCIDQEKDITKSSLLLTPFLEAEVTEKRWYWIEGDLGFCTDSIDNAFFY